MKKQIKNHRLALAAILSLSALSAQAQITSYQAGPFADATGDNTVAVGAGALANGNHIIGNSIMGSAAFGANAGASNGGVSIGSYSIADQFDEVSVGALWFTRRITNVSAGVAANDVVTVGQLQSSLAGLSSSDLVARDMASTASVQAMGAVMIADEAMTMASDANRKVIALDGRVTSLENRVRGLERDIDAAAATGAAMANAQMPNLAPGERAAVAGVGYSSGESALAVGVVGSNYAGQVFGVRLSVATNGKTTVGAGLGFKF